MADYFNSRTHHVAPHLQLWTQQRLATMDSDERMHRHGSGTNGTNPAACKGLFYWRYLEEPPDEPSVEPCVNHPPNMRLAFCFTS